MTNTNVHEKATSLHTLLNADAKILKIAIDDTRGVEVPLNLLDAIATIEPALRPQANAPKPHSLPSRPL